MSGLDEEQLSELEYLVAELLGEPWDKRGGRPRELTLREALIVSCGYLRQNIIEDVWAEIFGVAQSTVSRYITLLTRVHSRGRLSWVWEPDLAGHSRAYLATAWPLPGYMATRRGGRPSGKLMRLRSRRLPAIL